MESPSPVATLIDSIEGVIVGKRDTVELILAALLAGGHVLLQDVPGVGKTMLGRALARSIGGSFRRIQATPDLLPSDITGGMVYDGSRGEFRFVPGPLFGHIVLADELNRATPRTQAAFLEAMDEGHVTIEGMAHALPQPFFLIATLNPAEHHGTYPLPEGQLDRFLVAASLGYPTHSQEVEVVARQQQAHPIDAVHAVVEPPQLLRWQAQVREVFVDRSLVGYAVDVVGATRSHPEVVLGASPRATLGLVRLAQAWAYVHGRRFVLPDDVKHLARPVLSHRLAVRGIAGTAGRAAAESIVDHVLRGVAVPVVAR
ncbi:MAG TPA: MoxR family ATPase [bacterium]|nr:MoxR family ATPase [bacterium]